MIETVTPYVLTAAGTITAAAATYVATAASDIRDRVDQTERRSIANQRRQIGEPQPPETLDKPILDRLRELERRT